jgi:ribosomal protein L11 methyltransferase
VRAYSAYHFTIFPIEKTEIVSAWLTTFPFESYVEHDNGVTAYIPQDEAQKITLSDCLAIPFDDVTVSGSVEEIAGRNWNTVWEAQFQPITVGDWTIRASFHEPAKTAQELIIDPQMSFGTGHHATTQLMLSQILDLPCKNAAVLDVGTGTGVLAIMTKKLGATPVLGTDIEDWCVENAQENASKNGLTEMSFSTNTLDKVDAKFDIILANINRNVLIAHLPEYAKKLNANGVLLLSGFHESDVAVLTDLAQTHGLRLKGKTEKMGWICLKFLL